MDRDRSTFRRDPARWPVKVFHLGEEPGDDLSATTTVGQRLEMVWMLRDRMWELTGRPLPNYSRCDMPVKIIKS
jgi:hypothetical protein